MGKYLKKIKNECMEGPCWHRFSLKDKKSKKSEYKKAQIQAKNEEKKRSSRTSRSSNNSSKTSRSSNNSSKTSRSSNNSSNWDSSASEEDTPQPQSLSLSLSQPQSLRASVPVVNRQLSNQNRFLANIRQRAQNFKARREQSQEQVPGASRSSRLSRSPLTRPPPARSPPKRPQASRSSRSPGLMTRNRNRNSRGNGRGNGRGSKPITPTQQQYAVATALQGQNAQKILNKAIQLQPGNVGNPNPNSNHEWSNNNNNNNN